jgi:hypothetical protein
VISVSMVSSLFFSTSSSSISNCDLSVFILILMLNRKKNIKLEVFRFCVAHFGIICLLSNEFRLKIVVVAAIIWYT